MITFVKKTQPQPASTENEENRFEQVRKAAKEGHRKSEIRRNPPRPTDG
jgi:hypothetical protein